MSVSSEVLKKGLGRATSALAGESGKAVASLWGAEGASKGVSSFMKSSGLDSMAKMVGGGNVIDNALSNLKSVGLKGGGQYIEAAVKGAAVGAGVSGTSEWAQGGSFLGGAKRGILPGAALGMGGRAFQVGAGGENWQSNGGYKGAFNTHKGNFKEGYGAGAEQIGESLRNTHGISKPLEAILKQRETQALGKNVYGG